MTITYEIITRSVVNRASTPDQHDLKLLYRGDGTPWWACSAGLELVVSEDFAAEPGDTLEMTIRIRD